MKKLSLQAVSSLRPAQRATDELPSASADGPQRPRGASTEGDRIRKSLQFFRSRDVELTGVVDFARSPIKQGILANPTTNLSVLESLSPVALATGISSAALRARMLVSCLACFCVAGCKLYHQVPETVGQQTSSIDQLLCQLEQPAAGIPAELTTTIPPTTLRDAAAIELLTPRDLSMQEAISMALQNRKVLRDLGASVLRTPAQVQTDVASSLQHLNPQSSVEAALSAYDTQFYAFGKWQNNDRRFNNRFFGGGANAFKQDTHDYVLQLSKRTATGAQFSLRSITDYDANNATGNRTNSAWQTQLHAEARQPLLQGGGLQFNRIAGPAPLPGVYSGVLIAKVNSEITKEKFQQGVRDYVSDVVNAYWDLYFAYREADAKREAMLRAEQTWKSYDAQRSSNRKSGAAEALAREQFYRFQSEYQDAIAGKMANRTRNNNVTTGGAFAAVGGLQAAERRLRLILGMAITDGNLLRTSSEPSIAPILFDWDAISAEAITLRSELQQQRLKIKQKEMELLAAKNFLLPSLDLVSVYRLRGLDQNLAGNDSAMSDLGTLDLQEYEASLELKLPVGFRQGHLAVQHARLKVVRERAVLDAQIRQVTHDLTAMIADCDRAFTQVDTNRNRYLAASDALEALEASQKAGMPINFDQLLDAQRRVSDSQIKYYSSLVEYTIATKNVHLEKGTLLRSWDVLMVAE